MLKRLALFTALMLGATSVSAQADTTARGLALNAQGTANALATVLAAPLSVKAVDKNGVLIDTDQPAITRNIDSSLIASAAVSTTGSFTNPIFSAVDMTGYSAAIVNINQATSGNTLVCGMSNDGQFWYPVGGIPVDSSSGGITATRPLSGTAAYAYPRRGRYFTCYLSVASGSSVSINAYLQATPVVFGANNASVIGGSGNEGNALSASPLVLITGGARRPTLFACSTSTSAMATCASSITPMGSQVFFPYVDPLFSWTWSSILTNTTTASTIRNGVSGGFSNFLTSCQISTDALGGATSLVIRDGAGGTVLWRQRLQTAGLNVVQITFPVPLRATQGNLIEAATETAVTGGVYLSCQGFNHP